MTRTDNWGHWYVHLGNLVDKWKAYLRLHPNAHATADFETRSACELTVVGSWLYSKHPTTQAMCLSYKLPGETFVRRWHREHPGIPATAPPEELFAFIMAGGNVEAHNAFFERVIWKNVCAARMGWPEMPSRQWRCSAAKASASALPRDLALACNAMGLAIGKDGEGRKLMLKMSKPRKPTKKEVAAWKEAWGDTEMGLDWHEDPDDLERLWLYCDRDVLAEEAFSEAVPDLSPDELALWQINQELNERGSRFDLRFAKIALAAADKWKAVLNRELHAMTGIPAASQRAVVKAWLKEHEDLDLPDTTGEVVDFYLGRIEMSGRARRVLEILKQVNRTSIRKFQAMLKMCDPDDERARDLLMFHGANTGRDSGKGIQVHNFPRGKCENAWSKKDGKPYFDMDRAVEDALTGDVEWMASMAGDVMEMLSSALRGAVIPADGRDLIVADYAAIEARCVLWEANATEALLIFLRTDTDIYCDMATGIYGFEVRKKDHPNERQFGKQAVLGLGYGMGFITFLLTCRKYDITFSVEQVKGILKDHYDKYMDWVTNYLFPKPAKNPTPEQQKKDVARMRQAAKVRYRLIEKREDPKAIIHELALMKYTVDVYRSRYPEVKKFWSDLEEAAISAVEAWDKIIDAGLEDLLENRAWLETPAGTAWRDKIKGPEFTVGDTGKIVYYCDRGFLCCRLPSGRILRYRNPEVKPVKTEWGAVKKGLRYWTIVKGNKWARTRTYGGKLAENVTQAVARDIMMDAVRRANGDQGHTVEGNIITLHWGPKSVYDINFSVHDELLAEVDKDKGSVKDFENLMSETEEWADGCPILAEGKRFPRYRK